jgi:hypothetical protein
VCIERQRARAEYLLGHFSEGHFPEGRFRENAFRRMREKREEAIIGNS